MDKSKKNKVTELSLLTIVTAIKVVSGIDIRVKTRRRDIVLLKKLYYKIAKENTSFSLSKMGKFVETSNHATVLFHLKSVDYLIKTDVRYGKIYFEALKIIEKYIISNEIKKSSTKKEIVFIKKLVGLEGCGIPEYILNHLMEYSEEDLKTLYSTRIVPFKKMLVVKKEKERKVEKVNIF